MLILIGNDIFFMGCAPTADAQANHASNLKEDSMSLAYKTEHLAIPAIDAAVPSTFETASFGLG